METREFNGHDFMRECYLRSTPSVDLDEVTSDNPIDSCAHKLSTDEYNKILTEFGITDEHGNTIDHDRLVACNMWVLDSGPSLYEPKAA